MLIEKETPKLRSIDASSLALNLYGITIGDQPEGMPSYLDQNFYIENDKGSKYILKIANASEAIDTLDMQNKAMEHLIQKGFEGKIQSIVTSKNQKNIESVDINNETYHIRLFHYLEGQILAKLKPQKPHIMKDIGRLLAEIDKALIDFDHPMAHRFIQWDIAQAEKIIKKNIHHFQNDDDKALIQFYYDRFTSYSSDALAALRKQIIHADANNYNVLVQPDNEQFGKWNCSGILDFGDIVHTQTINELAIAVAYAMQDKANPLEDVLPLISAYHAENELSEDELSILFDLACIRLCLTLTNGAYRKTLEKNDYRDHREKSAWTLLKQLKEISPIYAEARFRHACQLSITKGITTSLNWINSKTKEFAKPISFDFNNEKYLTLDLSVGSEEYIGYDWNDKKTFSDYLVNRMQNENYRLAVTKYDEARLLFNGEKYRVRNEDYEEYRNIHLGVDFIIDAGHKVSSVLDGTVHHIIRQDPNKDLKNAVIIRHTPQDDVLFYTIYGNISTSLSIGDNVKTGQEIGELIYIDNWSPHLHFQIALDMAGCDTNYPVSTTATPTAHSFWTSISPDPNMIIGLKSKNEKKKYSVADIIERRSKLLGKNQKYYYHNPVNIVRSKAQLFYDENGRKYLDSLNNVTHVGHCHPKVVEAITKQSRLLNTNTRLIYEGIVRYAERLIETLPSPLSVCYFVCTGSEANDLALRLARHYTGQHDMLILDGAYHGNTTAVEQISPNRFDGPGGKGAMPFIHKIPQPNLYRGLYQYDDDNAGTKYGSEVKKIIDSLHNNGVGIAGMINESLMGTAGQVVLPDGFLKTAYAYVRESGGICIADEVQVGFARMGDKYWCFETQDVIPDIVVMGKPIANGFPMAMVVTTPEVAEAYNTGMKYFNTFGGNPVACAAGLAVLDIIEKEGLQQRAYEVGNYFLDSLSSLKGKHKLIGDVRGKGLYLGIEFVRDQENKTPAKEENYYISERMKEKGIIIYPNGKFDNCLKIKPPMIFSKNDVDFFVDKLDSILSETVFK